MIELKTTGEIGRAFHVKKEKADDDGAERITCTLAFAEAFVPRSVFDQFCKQPDGWHAAFYDDQGAPVGRFALALDGAKWSVTGTIRGTGKAPPTLNLLEADLTSVKVTPTRLGAVIEGRLAWQAKGDEVDDVRDLLGALVALDWRVTDGDQTDLFKATPDDAITRQVRSAIRAAIGKPPKSGARKAPKRPAKRK